VRVLHLTTEFPPVIYGGLGTATGGLVKALAKAGVEVAVLLFGSSFLEQRVGTFDLYGEIESGDAFVRYCFASAADAQAFHSRFACGSRTRVLPRSKLRPYIGDHVWTCPASERLFRDQDQAALRCRCTGAEPARVVEHPADRRHAGRHLRWRGIDAFRPERLNVPHLKN
jgi:glycosyl transferase family 5 (putative starch synthase catalytic subunit)